MPLTPALYRHDSVITQRPYDFDVDEDGWLWEGSTGNRLMGHNLRTAELDLRIVPEMGGHVVFSTFCWRGRIVMILHDAPFYLVYETATRRCERKPVPTPGAILWYGCKLPGDPRPGAGAGDRLMVCNRGGTKGEAWIFDAPDAAPRIIPVPYAGDFASATLAEDGLCYTFMSEPARVIRFDPKRERFIDETPLPWPEVGVAGRVSHKGVLYCADSAGGRLLPLDLKTQKWLDPIAHPDHGKVFGFIGLGFKAQDKLYFCLSTYAHRSRLDRNTGKIIMPPPGAKITVDGRDPRFMERLLTFDPAKREFGYLHAPEQPDGIPLLCYAWSDGTDFAVTGMVLPLESPGVPRYADGPWLILQSKPADRVPGFGEFDFSLTGEDMKRRGRRSYPRDRALYIAEPPHTPALAEFGGPATHYPPGRDAELLRRRAATTDPAGYWKGVLRGIVGNDADEKTKVRAILAHVERYLYYNPTQVAQTWDPIAVHETREGRCGHALAIMLELFRAAGVEARETMLSHHTVAETRYDGAWHIADAQFFGADQPERDGRVLSVEELRADLYYVDAYPQRCFVYDPELLMSQDGYQVLGYVAGLWGSEPYYSYYLGAPKIHPPTLPTMLPAQRLGKQTLRLNWTRSLKADPNAAIEYELRVCTDRACNQEVFRTLTRDTHADFDVPQPNRMYYAEVRAMDDHRLLNPATWYPPAKWNFVLAPVGQYGWYGVL